MPSRIHVDHFRVLNIWRALSLLRWYVHRLSRWRRQICRHFRCILGLQILLLKHNFVISFSFFVLADLRIGSRIGDLLGPNLQINSVLTPSIILLNHLIVPSNHVLALLQQGVAHLRM